jgi:hypothetical protein
MNAVFVLHARAARGGHANAINCTRRFVILFCPKVPTTKGGWAVYALIGRVELKPERAGEALSMIRERGVAMVQGMAGATGGYWARNLDGDDIQHSFWLFDTEENARAAEQTFNSLRNMPGAPATFVSVDVCEIVGQA